ncbi:unnamed protein product [Cladocopium goreaui]|uniref:Beta-glucoside kinase n=1 Tax=Cladocopium goreaui TaxID=2562237 RepID=A0A9P1CU21_9DINO|nr:unnamed protein product [Cladocopium goreaui]
MASVFSLVWTAASKYATDLTSFADLKTFEADLGGTTMSAGLLNAHGVLLKVLSQEVGEDHSPQCIVKRIRALLEALLCNGVEKTHRLEEIEALGVCTPGLMDTVAGVVRAAANLRGWREVPLVRLLAEELGWEPSRVSLENDTNAALLAEAWTGAAAGMKHIVLVTVGTGVGGAIMCDGRLLRGSKGQAGEIGTAFSKDMHLLVHLYQSQLRLHMSSLPASALLLCAYRQGADQGYAERHGKTWHMMQITDRLAIRAKEALSADSSLSELKALDCEDVFKHAEAGDKYASDLVQETARYLAIGCINCCRFVDPELILFSGGMAEAMSKAAGKGSVPPPPPSGMITMEAESIPSKSLQRKGLLLSSDFCNTFSLEAMESLQAKHPGKPLAKDPKTNRNTCCLQSLAQCRTLPDSILGAFIKLVVRRLTGEEISVQTELDVLIQNVRASVGAKLGVSAHRIKLLNEGQVLNKSTTVRESGLEDGAVLTTIVLPPVYGALGHAGISAPDEVISAKMELHEALSEAGKLKPVHTTKA